MKTLKITTCKGRLMCQYQGQSKPQGRYIEVEADGRLDITYNAEIGNAVPAPVWHGIIRRICGPWTTKAEAREFIAENRSLFQTLVDGMGERWDGNNYVGTLTEDAVNAERTLDEKANCDW